jgi:GNAT superfamily N-acetyltransferase
MMRVTSATSGDIPALQHLLCLLFSQEAEFEADPEVQKAGLQQLLHSPELGQILVLRAGGAVVGMVNLLFTVSTALGGRVAVLEDMIMHPEWRGCGAGSKLLLAAIDLCKTHGCRRITLLTDGSNQGAQRFYARHGFSPSPMLPMRLLL